MSAGHRHGGPECRAMFERLSEYLDEELDPGLCASLEDHMEDCAPCRAFLDSLRATVDLLAEAPRRELPEETRRELVERWRRLREAPGGAANPSDP